MRIFEGFFICTANSPDAPHSGHSLGPLRIFFRLLRVALVIHFDDEPQRGQEKIREVSTAEFPSGELGTIGDTESSYRIF
jgi:hypothetical protein